MRRTAAAWRDRSICHTAKREEFRCYLSSLPRQFLLVFISMIIYNGLVKPIQKISILIIWRVDFVWRFDSFKQHQIEAL